MVSRQLERLVIGPEKHQGADRAGFYSSDSASGHKIIIIMVNYLCSLSLLNL